MKIPCDTCPTFAICYSKYKEYSKIYPPAWGLINIFEHVIIPHTIDCKILFDFLRINTHKRIDLLSLEDVLPIFKTGKLNGKSL